ncbi:MAG: hypothetical protein ACOX6T_12060 [Myxococcales bacterium]|jgi:hypothetical protein
MRRLLAVAPAVLAAAFGGDAKAIELYEPGFSSAELGGSVKSWFVGGWPDQAEGILDLRLKLRGGLGESVTWELQPQLAALAGANAFGLAAAGAGAAEPPQAVDLSRTLADGMGLQARIDRASVRLRLSSFELTAGRQPISFGSTFFFAPMDLIAPFTPVALDREHKPGVDAVRADAYFGPSGKVTLLAAYGGGWDLEGAMLAAHGQATFGLFDVGLLAGLVRREPVIGLDTAGSVGGFGLRGEGTVTFPREGSAFARVALGVDRQLAAGLTVMAELYLQTLGATKPSDYLAIAAGERFQRGEIWALGRYYGALSVRYELLPIIALSLAAGANLADPSALVNPSLVWSIADEAELVAGLFLPVGERPKQMPGMTMTPGEPRTAPRRLPGLEGLLLRSGLAGAPLQPRRRAARRARRVAVWRPRPCHQAGLDAGGHLRRRGAALPRGGPCLSGLARPRALGCRGSAAAPLISFRAVPIGWSRGRMPLVERYRSPFRAMPIGWSRGAGRGSSGTDRLSERCRSTGRGRAGRWSSGTDSPYG